MRLDYRLQFWNWDYLRHIVKYMFRICKRLTTVSAVVGSIVHYLV